ncbi:alpha/beta fold hydrolase [Dyadobacter subterraneus]|uniref:T9SS type A sorting domain-containing protein n=1 Tax=Dyadobacter subterraneus TaxID=2773304 RepID=A0ABR9WCC9_9BACT|nr:alpha/beta fold hydrolase [Dyadobacter subterraneus]MBE9461899.1 T9SS type A sorting domain-containing protein [Dyadobacter subterraneus]
MKIKFTFLFTFLAVIICYAAHSQSKRNTPYPILFVHGWTGSDQTWYNELLTLKSQNLNVDIDYIRQGAGAGSLIEFMLNADYNNNTSIIERANTGPRYGDVLDKVSYVNPDNDVFVINFDVDAVGFQSNQAAVAKQGFAVGLAIKKILSATGAEKVVLFGHSMGGLAIREYLQNPINWRMNDSQHHVAKLITSGTPHFGSNASLLNLRKAFTGADEFSEAVRDLRDYSTSIYLKGGYESAVSNSYGNKDVDCNGMINYIIGLNQKDNYTGLHFACIIGIGGQSLLGILGTDDDDVVSAYSANLFNIQYATPLKGEIFYADASKNQTLDLVWHTKLPEEVFQNQYALDEPSELELAYDIQPDRSYRGFLTPHLSSTDLDYDRYKITLPQRGILSFNSNLGKDGGVQLIDGQGYMIQNLASVPTTKIKDSGVYYIGINGSTGASTGYSLHFVPYKFSTSFCTLPELPVLASQGTSQVCDGESVALKINNVGYDSYNWYYNDKLVGSGPSFTADKAGTYYVEGKKCGIAEKSINTFKLDVKARPSKPEILVLKGGLSSSSQTGNQWFHDGMPLPGETSQVLNMVGAGAYTVKVTQNDCSTESDVFTITGLEDDRIQNETIVFPNPSDGNFQITSPLTGPLLFTVTDINGKEISSMKRNLGGKPILLNLGRQPGLYLLKVNSGKIEFYKKIVVE